MRNFLHMILLVAIAAILGGCSGQYLVQHAPFGDYPYRQNIYDMEFAWRTLQSRDGLTVEGIVKSVNHPHIYGLDVRVSLLDKERKLISDAIYFSIPPQMANGDYRQFNLALKGKAAQGSSLQFLYRYEVEEQDQKFHWVNSFDVDVATGAVRSRE